MEKVVNAFAAERTLKNALAVHKHLARHPMAECMATVEERKLITQARLMAAGAR